ncbi:hypothetical protein TRFO_04879 [Tritrichomonas foetus]|uniref:Uncharacterized protein n=1 Tax=Tritrichomonas foetus TaxID=1144522 RepID=A0A1J4KFA3_9EUKA|nr:hypothetical protein TRFO_04879 [Tritrichomonas foetus]|eukprot:OHT08278.1 hypothetical protein TRFO_04879 [Tritrichomonas foetus]
MESTSFRLSGFTPVVSSYIDSLALNPQYHSLATFLKKLKVSDPQLRINASQATKLESLLKGVCESVSAINDRTFSVSYDAFIKFYKTINLSHNLLHRYYKGFVTQAEDENKKMKEEFEPLKSKSREYDTLKVQLNDAKTRLSASQRQASSSADSARKQIIQDISKQFKLSSKIADVPTLVKSIKTLMAKNLLHIKTLTKEFQLPSNTTKDSIVSELKKEFEKQQKSSNENLEKKDKEIKELQKQINELKEKVMDESDFSQDEDKRKLQKTIIRQKRQIRNLESELNNNTRNKAEVEGILKLYDDLSNQYRSQSKEMLDAINARTTLITCIEKQNMIIAALDDQLEKVSNPQFRPHDRSISQSIINDKTPSKVDASKLEKDIIKLLLDVPVENDEIQTICHENHPLTEKVRLTLHHLTDFHFTNKDLLETNQKLFSVIIGQFKFIQSLSNSKDCFNTLYPDLPYDECRNLVIAQVARIQHFINTYARGLAEDSCLFDDLLKTQNSQNFLDSIKKYLGRYAKPQSLESEELFILLLQSVACNDILRQYGNEARKHNATLAQKYKQLKDYSGQAKKALEIQSSTMIQESNSKVQETIIAAKSLLRKSLLQESSQNPEIVNYLEELDNIAPVKDNEYVRALQKQNGELRKEMFELKNARAKLMNDAKTDIEAVQKQIQQIKDESNKRLGKKNEENVKLANKLKQTILRLGELKRENTKMNESIALAEKKYKQFEEQSNTLVCEIQDQLSSTKADFENLLRETQMKNEEFQQSKILEMSQFQDTIKKTNEALQKENSKLKKALRQEKDNNNNLTKKYDETCERYEEACNKYEEKIATLKHNEIEALDAADTVSKQFKEIHNDHQKLEIEFKALQLRFDSKDEASKRDKSILESQLNAKIMAVEHDAQTAIEAAKSAQLAKQQLLLGEICKYFPGFVNIQSPISEETVFAMLQKVRDSIKDISDSHKSNELLKEIAEIVAAEDYSTIPSIIKDLLNDIENKMEALEAFDVAKATIEQYQDWLQRLYMIITNGMVEEVTRGSMQKSIEDALLASVGKNSVVQRLETLKAEKKLLLMKVQDVVLPKKNKITFRHLMILMMYTMRMKKLSGNMENQYSFATNIIKGDSDEGTFLGESPFSNLFFA